MSRRRVVAAKAYRRLLLPCAESALNLCKCAGAAWPRRRATKTEGSTSICRYEPCITSTDEKRSDARDPSHPHSVQPCCSPANAGPQRITTQRRLRRSGPAGADQRHEVGLRRQGHHRRRRHGRARLGRKNSSKLDRTAARCRTAARAEPRRARAAFLAKRPRLHEFSEETRADGRDARYKTGRARVCATL